MYKPLTIGDNYGQILVKSTRLALGLDLNYIEPLSSKNIVLGNYSGTPTVSINSIGKGYAVRITTSLRYTWRNTY